MPGEAAWKGRGGGERLQPLICGEVEVHQARARATLTSCPRQALRRGQVRTVRVGATGDSPCVSHRLRKTVLGPLDTWFLKHPTARLCSACDAKVRQLDALYRANAWSKLPLIFQLDLTPGDWPSEKLDVSQA